MNCRFEAVDGGQKLIIEGEMTIEHAVELKAVLLRSLEENVHAIVDFQKVTAIDLSALQLLCSAHRTAAVADKRFSFHGKAPEVLSRAVRDAGYGRFKGCALDANASCVWCGGSK